MATLTNASGDTVTVNLGGFGGDNVQGTVSDSLGVPIAGAKVTVTNTANMQQEQGNTNANGVYDYDLDASVGDRVFVHAEFKDATGKVHVIRGFVVLAAATTRIDSLKELEDAALDLATSEGVSAELIVDAYALTLDSLINTLNDLRQQGRERHFEAIDRMFLEEYENILRKLRYIQDSGRPPRIEDLYSLLLELFMLITKMLSKLFWLQGAPPPELPRPDHIDVTTRPRRETTRRKGQV